MDLIHGLIDFILHLDKHLEALVEQYGGYVYGILFTIVFCETGLVVMPILPGDSLLFAAGAIAAKGQLNLWFMMLILMLAAILGDTVNYWIGHYIGPRIFSKPKSLFFNPQHLQRTHHFYEKYGNKTIVIARFVPIVRTFAPFVAGVGEMPYLQFMTYNVIGSLLWVPICAGAGYLFGQLPFVKNHFELVILGIIVLSMIPMVVEVVKHKLGRSIEN